MVENQVETEKSWSINVKDIDTSAYDLSVKIRMLQRGSMRP